MAFDDARAVLASTLPRHSCRGLIEASKCFSVMIAIASRLFPGIRAGASLKRPTRAHAQRRRAQALPRHSCRGLIEAPCGCSRRTPRAMLFPGIRAGASLKPLHTWCRPAGCEALPRHSCRGLIEACSLLRENGDLCPALPRHSCRGLIEASTCCGRSSGARIRALPRHSCRGLIEASGPRGSQARNTALPRHSCRGLIEALVSQRGH